MLNVYSVYDSQAKTYNTPFFMRQDGQALRAFMDLVNNPQTDVAKHPSDYILFRLASYDEETGYIESHESPQRIGCAWELVEKESTTA